MTLEHNAAGGDSRRSTPLRWALASVGLATVLGVFVLGSALRGPADSDRSARSEVARSVRRAPQTGDQRRATAPFEASRPVSTRSIVRRPRHEEGFVEGDAEPSSIAGPTPGEASGMLRRLFDRWWSEPEDIEATREAISFVREALIANDIAVRSFHVRCSPSLCRARFRFDQITELHKLKDIERPEDMDVATTFPERMDEEFVDISSYWGAPGVALAELIGQGELGQ